MKARLVLALILLIAPATSLRAADRKIERSQLPPAVEKTLVEQSKNAEILGLEQERTGGKIRYEAELLVNGHRRDVLIDESGAVVEIEEQVAFETLPGVVQEGLRAAAGSARIVKVEAITRSGKLASYEAIAKTDKRRREIEVDPDGKPIGK